MKGQDPPPAPLRLPRFPFHQGELPALAKRLHSQLSLDDSLTPLPVGGADGAGTVQSGLFAS